MLEDVLNFATDMVDDVGRIVFVLGDLVKILEEDIDIQSITGNLTVSGFFAESLAWNARGPVAIGISLVRTNLL